MFHYSKSCIGYNHIKNGTLCEDFSASYADSERVIVTTCDGHGGNIYIRSDLGSKFASDAIINVCKNIRYHSLRGTVSEEYLNKLKLQILVEWNKMIERHLCEFPIRKHELKKLDVKELIRLKNNPEKAYGTTLIGTMVIGNKLLVIQLGDGASVLLKKGRIEQVFEEDEDEPVANVTYSMCAEDAYKHINIRVLDFNKYDGILICTDGVINPYQNYENFEESMVRPLVHDLLTTKSFIKIDQFVDDLGTKLGIGDDVSLGFILKEDISRRNYKF